jgi:hypothetical protein
MWKSAHIHCDSFYNGLNYVYSSTGLVKRAVVRKRVTAADVGAVTVLQ